MQNKKSIVGQKFNRLTVIERTNLSKNNRRLYKCECICGNITLARSSDVKGGNIKSCGCLLIESRAANGAAKALNLTGQKFGRLVVIKRIENRGKGVFWLCECSCGNTTEVQTNDLRDGGTQSCGCLRREINVPNLTGKVFGRLTVIDRAGSIGKNSNWLCQCECGNFTHKTGIRLRWGEVQSCGCLRRDVTSKLGSSRLGQSLTLEGFKIFLNNSGFDLITEIDENSWQGITIHRKMRISICCIYNTDHIFTLCVGTIRSKFFDCPRCHSHEGSAANRLKGKFDAILEVNGLKIEI